jgi:hypothetical protein
MKRTLLLKERAVPGRKQGPPFILSNGREGRNHKIPKFVDSNLL